jgi:P-type Cu2+ transporter
VEEGASFCCHGCEAVYGLLAREGLDRYYDLRDEALPPPDLRARDHKWIDLLEASAPPSGTRRLTLDVQGVQCAACVWLFDKLFQRHEGALSILINPALGKMDLTVGQAFSLRTFVEDVERFGYALGPSLKEGRTSSEILTRLGVSVAIAMNAMLFSIAIYAGLDEGPIYRFFQGLIFALGTLSVLVGGTVFFRSAWQALRRRVLHLDVPIALGIVLAYAGSAYAYLARGGSTYFDTLTIFIALMLVGRLLQERVVDKNRRMILASDGAEGLLTRRLEDGVVKVVRCAEVSAGDVLLVAPGDLVVVPGLLEDGDASCSLDWINGESVPRPYSRGEEIPAGAFNVGEAALLFQASVPFSESPLVSLLMGTRERNDAARSTRWWQVLSRVYVVAVLGLAAIGFLGWWIATRDVERALLVTAAILIVTCPCAFGIATPFGYELVAAGLRRAGLFIRTSGFLDRAAAVRRVVFDKTGTLTTGSLELSEPDVLDVLDGDERAVLYNLVARSGHPKSQAIARALEQREKDGVRFVRDLGVVEKAGVGLALERAGRRYSLHGDANGVPTFFIDGAERATFPMRENLRGDARREVRDLRARGYDVWILSGDEQGNVDALAERIGLPKDRAVGNKSPEQKAAFLRELDRGDTLVVGDGLNDSLALDGAFCSGTPAVDRPFLPARSDFYFTTPGLRPIGLAIRAATALERVTRRNLTIAIAYNVVTVGLALAGLLSPLACAVLMPASSITVVLATVVSLSPRSSLWKQ